MAVAVSLGRPLAWIDHPIGPQDRLAILSRAQPTVDGEAPPFDPCPGDGSVRGVIADNRRRGPLAISQCKAIACGYIEAKGLPERNRLAPLLTAFIVKKVKGRWRKAQE